MRWSQPKHNDVRWKRKFAFFPTKVENHIIWFESYYVRSVYDCPHPWGKMLVYNQAFLNDSPTVKAYLLTLSPLAQAMAEKDN